MIRRSHKPAALRDAWTLPPDDGSRGRLARRIRRLAAVLFLIALAAIFTYLLIIPFWHPMLQPVFGSGGGYDGFSLPSFPYALADAEAIREPLAPGATDLPKFRVHVLRSPSDLQQVEAALAELPAGRRDVQVVYLAAHGIVMDGKPYLLCQDFDPTNPEAGRYPLQALLDRLAQSTAGAKLLILDAGRLDYDTRLGVLVNEFPQLLQTAVRENREPYASSLWVLASHSPLEVALNIHAKRQSAFGHFVAEGLGGAADANQDGLLGLGELYGFVRLQLGHHARSSTGGRRTQTPQLLQGGKDEPLLSQAPVLRAVGLDLAALVAAETNTKGAATGKGSGGKNDRPTDDAKKSPSAKPAATTSDEKKPAGAETDSPTKDDGASSSTKEPRGPDAPTKGDDATADAAGGNEGEAAAVKDSKDAKADATSSESKEARRTPNGSTSKANSEKIEVPAAETSVAGMIDAARRANALLDRRDPRRTPHPLTVAAPVWKAWRERLHAYDEVRLANSKIESAEIARAVRRDLKLLAGLPASDPTEVPSPFFVGLAALRSAPSISADQLPTWALAEQAHQWGGPALSTAVSMLVEKLDNILAADDDAPMRDLAKQAWPTDAERYAELRFARRMLQTPGLSMELRRAAWRCQRRAEATAADPFATVAWIRQRIELADSHRLAGERGLRDQLGAEWRAAALARFERATAEYATAERALVEVHAALHSRNKLLDRASNYLRWFHAGAGDTSVSPVYEDLLKLFEQLASLSELLEDLDKADLPKLANQHDQLELTRARIESILQPAALVAWLNASAEGPGKGWRAEVLLQSGLVPVQFESRLRELVRTARVEEKVPLERIASASAQHKILVADDWIPADRQLQLELRLARLATSTDDRANLDQLEAVIARKPSANVDGAGPGSLGDSKSDVVWKLWGERGAALATIHSGIASRVTTVLQQNGDLRDGERRAESLRRLREADRIMRLIDVRDVARLGQTDVAARVRQAALYDLLAWHRSRALTSLSDAPQTEADEALARAALCRRLAQELPQEPPLPDLLPPVPTVDGSIELPLVTQARRELPLRFRPAAGDNGPVWLVLAFDPELIEVSVADVPVYLEHEVRAKLAAVATKPADDLADLQVSDYPLRPQAAGLAPSWEVVGGAPRDLRLVVRRKVSAGRSVPLIVKFIGEDFSVRHEAVVLMSTLDAISLVPSGFPGSWSQQESLLLLHPLPNQRTDFRFALVNHGENDKTVDVEMVALRQPLSSPSVLTLPTQDALDAIGPTDVIGRVPQLKLPAGGEPVPLIPPPAGAANEAQAAAIRARGNRLGIRLGDSLGGDVNGGGADDPAKPADAKSTNAASLPPLEGTRMNHGLVLIIRDPETKQTLFRRIEFRPLHPRAFLSVNVGYDLAQQRIELIVTPRDRSLIPAKGLKIRCESPEPLPAGTEARLEGLLTGPQFETRLYLRVSAEDGRVQPLAISVDGYPRAFFYRVPCGVRSENVPEADDVLAVRVLAPDSGQWYKAPVETIPVRVEVDAPRGSFANGRDLIEIGLDADRDREFRGEIAIPFSSDRQSEVATQGFQGPVLGVETRIGDFQFDLPTGGLRNVRANVLGRAMVGNKVAWSAPVEVVLDGTPPVIRRVQLSADKPAVGSEVEVVVAAVDGQMSGVDTVEVGLDPRFEGKFGSGPPPVMAIPTDPTVWKAKLPLEGVEAGLSQILVRTTDKAGNASDYTKLQVTVVPKQDGDPAKAALPGRIDGNVTYAERPIPNADVTLEGEVDPKTRKRKEIAAVKADAQGRFAFPNVPPGKYNVKVRGLANNRTRLGSQEVTVVSSPSKTPPVSIRAK